MKYNVNASCPCGSGKKYKKCCQIYHKGAPCENALLLMKSRYSAYAVGDVNYIMKTQKERDSKEKIIKFMTTTRFEKLEILDSNLEKERSTVTFRVHLEQEGKPVSYSEKSLFIKEDDGWVYVSGEVF